MKLIHLADLHLGKRVNEFSMLEDQKYILKEILSIIDQERPDGVMIAGDVYDKPVPSAEAVGLFDAFLNELAARQIETFVISGNHDSAERIAFGCQLMDGSGVHMSPVYDGTCRPITMHDAYGEVDIWMLPFLRPVNVRRFYGEGGSLSQEAGEEAKEESEEKIKAEARKEAKAEKQQETEEKAEEQVNDSSEKSSRTPSTPACDTYEDAMRLALSQLPLDPARRNVLITHQFVTGASRTDSEEKSLGGTDNIGTDVFEGFDYVALGHIHRPQNMALGYKPGHPIIRYAGSPLKYSFSECKDVKSVTIVEIGQKGRSEKHTAEIVPEGKATKAGTSEAGNAKVNDTLKDGSASCPADFISLRTVPLTPLHDMRELRGNYADLTLRANYEDTAVDDYLHITLTDEQDIPDAMRRLQTIYPNLMKVDYDNTRTRMNSHILEKSAALTRTPMEMMDSFYKEQNGQDLNEPQKDYLQELVTTFFQNAAQ